MLCDKLFKHGFKAQTFLNEKACVCICPTLQSQMTRSALTISFWVIYVWLCRDSSDFFNAYLSAKAIYVWLCRDFDFLTEQCSAENRPTFRRIQTGLLCRARSNIFIRVLSTMFFNHWLKISFRSINKKHPLDLELSVFSQSDEGLKYSSVEEERESGYFSST